MTGRIGIPTIIPGPSSPNRYAHRPAAAYLGHPGLAAAIVDVAHEWNDRREEMVESIAGPAEACTGVGEAFERLDRDLGALQVAGVPVPASLVVHPLEVPGGEEPDERDLLVDLEERLRPPPGAAPTQGFALGRSRVPSGPVLRRVKERSADLEGAEPQPSLVADYWIERPDRAGLVLLAFATPMVGLRSGMLELFDAIAGALH